ncbi:thioredoxin family protein [Georgenia faecalis]|uniref:Thioredoxin family protein n=1 Tax=Georgenia faecalis TaxID=2483799 RepID=A0ABV9DBG8_9MICO|nr:thioredoxin family protein [Georgenia faecalis]
MSALPADRYAGRPRQDSGRSEPAAGPRPVTRLDPSDLGVPGARLGSRATLVQISTAFCAPCRAARAVLGRVAEQADGVVHLDVDVTGHEDVAERLGVTSTPTILVLDADGGLVARRTGVPRLADVRALLDTIPQRGSAPRPPTGATPS